MYDLVLNTIPVEHDSSVYNKLLKKGGGKQVILGLTTQLVANLIGMKTGVVGPKTKFVGSGIGSIKATQEVGREKNAIIIASSLSWFVLPRLI